MDAEHFLFLKECYEGNQSVHHVLNIDETHKVLMFLYADDLIIRVLGDSKGDLARKLIALGK